MTPRYFHTSEMKYRCQSFCHIHNLSTPQTNLTDLQILEFLHSACTQIHIPSITGRHMTPRYFHSSEMTYRCQSFCHIHNLSTPQTNLTYLHILEFLHSVCIQFHILSIVGRHMTPRYFHTSQMKYRCQFFWHTRQCLEEITQKMVLFCLSSGQQRR